MDAGKLREATSAAQLILRNTDAALVADGWWGAFTNQTYVKSNSATKMAVDRALAVFGVTRGDLYGATNDISRKAKSVGDNWVNETYLLSLIKRASGLTNIPEDTLFKFLKLEAAVRTEEGVRYYNAKSIAPNGLFHGLFQMGAPAWSDVMRLGKIKVPSFTEGRYDAWWNTIAAAQYILINQAYARSKGFKGQFTPEVLYALHNQGAAGFMKLLRTATKNSNLTNQSGKAQMIIATAAQQNGVTLA